MLNIIQIWPVAPEKRIFKVFFIDSFKGNWPRSLAAMFLDIIMNFRNLQEGHLRTNPAKHISNIASGFREEDF